MMPNATGLIPSCSTRYIGSTLATISDDTSVRRLVKPSAQTVGLIREKKDRASGRTAVAASVPAAGVADFEGARPKIALQSMAYMIGQLRDGRPGSKAPASRTAPERENAGLMADKVFRTED